MTPEAALLETVRFAAEHAEHYSDRQERAPWLVSAVVLAAQQAATIALRANGDSIPAQAGATELLLRAASKDRLAPPFTLPFGSGARQNFDRLVEARNAFMHPRGALWHVSDDTLVRGLPVATGIVRHLILTQPVLTDLVSPAEQETLRADLDAIDALAEFLSDTY